MRKFVYGPGIDEPICLIDVANSNAIYYYHCDGLGSVVALCDVNNVPVERYAYDVFGRPTIRDVNGVPISQSAFGNPYLFTARAYDAESGLYYYRARYYDYSTGRFLQPDPTGYADGINWYTYCGNNPVGLVDPLGLDWLDNAANFSAGMADTISFNVTARIRRLMGTQGTVSQQSGWYKGGVAVGVAHGLAMGGGGILKGGRALLGGTTRPIMRLIYDERRWTSISRAFWGGEAGKRQLHHWMITQKFAERYLPAALQGFANGAWNTVVVRGSLNMWMGRKGLLNRFGEWSFRGIVAGSLGAPLTAFLNWYTSSNGSEAKK